MSSPDSPATDAAPQPTAARTAVVYLPGLFAVDGTDELAAIGRKLAISLDKSAHEGKPVFESAEDYADLRGEKVKICRLQRRESNTSEPVADLFLMDYRPALLERYQQRSLPSKCLLTAFALVVMLAKVLRHLFCPRHKVKLLRDRFQALLALGGVALVGAYLGLLVVATVKVGNDALTAVFARQEGEQVDSPSPTNSPAANPGTVVTNQGSGTNNSPAATNSMFTNWSVVTNWPWTNWSTTNWPMGTNIWRPLPPLPPKPFWERWYDKAKRCWRRIFDGIYIQSANLFVILTALGLLAPNRDKFRAALTQISEEMVAFANYFSFGERRAEITGALENYLEKVVEAGDGHYDRYIVLSYSFGSIVAIDTLFPTGSRRAARLEKIQTLVTIGSPHDFVLTFWPRYFAGRHAAHKRPETWINVYSPIDLLASEFGEDRKKLMGLSPSTGRDATLSAQQSPTTELMFREGLTEERLDWVSWLFLMGLRVHSMYWSHQEDGERNCFDDLAPLLFPNLTSHPDPTRQTTR